MKKLSIALSASCLLSACASSTIQSDYSKQTQKQASTQAATMQSAVDKAPEWMFKLPKVDGVVFENGTATSGDFALADMKAKAIAYAKICTSAGGKIRSQTKVLTQDNGTTTNEQSEMAIRSLCSDVDISGVETVEMKHIAEGNRIRTYVLVALNKNARSQKSAKEAFEELDKVADPKATGAEQPAPQKSDEINVTNPNGTSSTLNLMPVENADYKARRAEALQKPGAVIGQSSISN
jgi:hypothetical protein